MLNDVKLSLRITSTAFDIEVQDLIEAARLDLVQSGISLFKASDDADPLIKRAITLYCKAFFGYDNPDADRLRDSYVMLKQHLSLAADYNGANDAV
jgi:uncharacterized phage protein (predicted DNA packaging)